MTTPFSSSLQDLSVCWNHPQIISWQPKIRGHILETSNSWMTKKCTKNENWVYYKHPTHGYDQHDDQPTYPKSRPCTRSIQLMDDWHIQKDKKIHSPVTQMTCTVTRMTWTWLCWMNSSVEWSPTSDLDMISAKNCTKNKQKVLSKFLEFAQNEK
jgi:hypothetical protein